MIDEFRIRAPRSKDEAYIVVEFTREDLEKLVVLFPPTDKFTYEVRVAMRLLNGEISKDAAERLIS